MRIRFRIRHILVVSAAVALFMGLFAPELRSWDRSAKVIFSVVGGTTALLLVSFTPVWIVLRWFRKRSNRGLTIEIGNYMVLGVAYISSLGIFVALCCALSALLR